MIKTSFQKKMGDPSLGILFCWKLTIDADSADPIVDHLIPEMFYDFFFIQFGEVSNVDKERGIDVPLAKQTLKTIHTRPLTLAFSPSLILLGARLSLQFAETYWEQRIPSNHFLTQNWVEPGDHDLTTFMSKSPRR